MSDDKLTVETMQGIMDCLRKHEVMGHTLSGTVNLDRVVAATMPDAQEIHVSLLPTTNSLGIGASTSSVSSQTQAEAT